MAIKIACVCVCVCVSSSATMSHIKSLSERSHNSEIFLSFRAKGDVFF